MINKTGRVLGTGELVPGDSPSSPSSPSPSSTMTPLTPKSPLLPAQTPEDISLDDIEDEEERKKVQCLLGIFPSSAVTYVRNALITCLGEETCTAALLFGDLSTEIQGKASKLKKAFPQATSDQVRDALILCQGSLDDALKQLRIEIGALNLPTVSTSTTATSHINGVIQSLQVSTKTHTTSAVKSKSAPKPLSKPMSTSNMIDLTESDSDSDSVRNPFLMSEAARAQTPAKQEEHGNVASPRKVGSHAEKVRQIREVLEKASPIACGEILDRCDGNVKQAIEIMINDPSTQMFLGACNSRTWGSKSAITPSVEKVEPMEESNGGAQEQNKTTPAKAQNLEYKIFQLLERPSELDPKACTDTLEAWPGSALDTLMAESIADRDKSEAYRESSPDGEIPMIRACRERRLATLRAESPTKPGKRRADSLHSHKAKKVCMEHFKDFDEIDADADDEDEDEDEKESKEVHLAPAAQWIKKTYPESTYVAVLLGPDRVRCDTIPCNVLRESFEFLKHRIEGHASQKTGTSKLELTLPDVAPATFELLVQWVICDNIELDSGPNEEHITSILNLISAAIKLRIPSVGSLITRMVSKLKAILSRDRLALKGSHIRAAYGLEENGSGIQGLFILASVRLFLQCKDDNSAVSHFKDDEDEDMTPARKTAYSGSQSGFAFYREMKHFPEFKEKLWDYAYECIKSRETAKRNPKSRSNVLVTLYTDPLTTERFEL